MMKSRKGKKARKPARPAKLGASLKLDYAEIAPVRQAFNAWLEQLAGKQAVRVMWKILLAEMAAETYRDWPQAKLADRLTAEQRGFIRQARKGLQVAAAWLAKRESAAARNAEGQT